MKEIEKIYQITDRQLEEIVSRSQANALGNKFKVPAKFKTELLEIMSLSSLPPSNTQSIESQYLKSKFGPPEISNEASACSLLSKIVTAKELGEDVMPSINEATKFLTTILPPSNTHEQGEEYWKSRCLAAEKVISVSKAPDDNKSIFETWKVYSDEWFVFFKSKGNTPEAVSGDYREWDYHQWLKFIQWYSGMKESSVYAGIRQYNFSMEHERTLPSPPTNNK